MSQVLTDDGTRRDRNKAARRARILDAAADLLASSGPEGLSMRRLAEAAELSVNTIYNLIGPRDAVVAELVAWVIEVIEEAVDEAGDDDPLARCVAVIGRSASVVIENERLTRPLAQEIFGHGGPGATVSRRWGIDTLRRAIEEAVDAGELTSGVSPAALARTVYAVWANSALSWAHGEIDAEGFEAAALHGLHLALSAVATGETKPRLQRGLEAASRRLDATIETRP